MQLFHHLQKEKFFPEPRCRFYAAEITSALGYLHAQNIIYRLIANFYIHYILYVQF